MRYLVVLEQGPKSIGAHVPDLPGCVAAGASEAEVMQLIRDAIAFHLEGLKADGLPTPAPCCSGHVVEVSV